MNRFVAILTVLSVLAHAVVGCCAHTAHFAACHTIDSDHGEHAASHSHHNDNDATPPCDHEPGEDHTCHHAKCQWLPASNNMNIAIGSPFLHDCLVCDMATLQAIDIHSRRLADHSESPPELPLRSHLALSILLI